jgi:hypothetical protein
MSTVWIPGRIIFENELEKKGPVKISAIRITFIDVILF